MAAAERGLGEGAPESAHACKRGYLRGSSAAGVWMRGAANEDTTPLYQLRYGPSSFPLLGPFPSPPGAGSYILPRLRVASCASPQRKKKYEKVYYGDETGRWKT